MQHSTMEGQFSSSSIEATLLKHDISWLKTKCKVWQYIESINWNSQKLGRLSNSALQKNLTK